MMTAKLTDERVVAAVIQWVETLGKTWPLDPPDVLAREFDAHATGIGRYALSSLFLWLVAIYSNEWPTISPKEFCRQAKEERNQEKFRKQLLRGALIIHKHETEHGR